MALNYIWIFFICSSLLVGIVQYITGINTEVFTQMVQSTFDMSKTSVDISIYLIGVMTLWLGIMKVGEQGGAIQYLSKIISPILQPFFPNIPNGHPAMGAMIMNISANMLGLDNAATPMGLKAMDELQKLNTTKETASNEQIMFLVLNTSGLTIIPISIFAICASLGSMNPSGLFLPILITTGISTLAGLLVTSWVQKISFFQKRMLPFIFSLVAIGLIIFGLFFFNITSDVLKILPVFGNFLILSIIVTFILISVLKKQNTYAIFIEGAKEGFKSSIQIIPYLVAMLVAIGLFRSSGFLDYLIAMLKNIFDFFPIREGVFEALPTALLKPLSGSGARGMMIETMKTYGVDSFAGKLSAIFQGSTETTLYVLSVYFGYVKITKIRHALFCGLLADFVGISAAIIVALLLL